MANKQIESFQEQTNWHWRNSMRPVRFFGFDARAAFPFLLLLVYARLITLVLAIISTILFYFLEKYGLTFDAAIRRLRSYISGQKRPALMTFRLRRLKDYG